MGYVGVCWFLVDEYVVLHRIFIALGHMALLLLCHVPPTPYKKGEKRTDPLYRFLQ